MPQSVHPVAAGLWPLTVPYTSKPLRPSGLEFDRFVTVIRTQRAVEGLSSSISTTPPTPEAVRYTVVHVWRSRDVSMVNSTAQLDRISWPVVLSRGLPLVDGVKTGSSLVASNVSRSESTSHSDWRSTEIH